MKATGVARRATARAKRLYRIVVRMVVAALLLMASPTRAAIAYTHLYALGKPTGFDSALPIVSGAVPGGWPLTAGGQVAGSGSGAATGNDTHAVLWTPSATTGMDINPAGFSSSRALSTSGTQQVGWAYNSATSYHAILWNGSASGAIDLHPAGYADSMAYGISGTRQFGNAYRFDTAETHALMWSGSASSVVDLNPSGFTYSIAYGASATRQVGSGRGSSTGGELHALTWNGSAASRVDLHPNGFIRSEAFGAGGVQQVGYGLANSGNEHALLWSGSASSAVDLNPVGFTFSYAYATDGARQVGHGRGAATGDNNHALLWSGTAATATDLHSVLPASFSSSQAQSIEGSTIYGWAYDGNYHAVTWSIPEPSSLWLLCAAAAGMTRQRRRILRFAEPPALAA